MLSNSHNIQTIWAVLIFGFSCCLILRVILLMSAEDGAVLGPSGLASMDSSHSGPYLLMAPEDIQQITGVVVGMLRSSSASPLLLYCLLCPTVSLTATNTTVSHSGPPTDIAGIPINSFLSTSGIPTLPSLLSSECSSEPSVLLRLPASNKSFRKNTVMGIQWLINPAGWSRLWNLECHCFSQGPTTCLGNLGLSSI